jgi:hypothetical protein
MADQPSVLPRPSGSAKRNLVEADDLPLIGVCDAHRQRLSIADPGAALRTKRVSKVFGRASIESRER